MALDALLYPHLLFIESLAPRSALVHYPVAPAAQHVDKMADTEVNRSRKRKPQPMLYKILNRKTNPNEQTNQIVNFLKYTDCDIYYDNTNVLIELA